MNTTDARDSGAARYHIPRINEATDAAVSIAGMYDTVVRATTSSATPTATLRNFRMARLG